MGVLSISIQNLVARICVEEHTSITNEASHLYVCLKSFFVNHWRDEIAISIYECFACPFMDFAR